MFPCQKKEKESVDLFKKTCILEKKGHELSYLTWWNFLSTQICNLSSTLWIKSLKKKKRPSLPLRERLAFQGPDTFYRKLQRVCSTILNFYGFHLLRQIGAGPLYPSKVIPINVTSSTPDGNLDQCSNYNMNTRRKGYMRYLSAITNLSPPVIPISPFSSTYQILTIL